LYQQHVPCLLAFLHIVMADVMINNLMEGITVC